MTEEEIDSNEELLRWLHPGQFDWKEKRPTSAAFKDQYMSVDIASRTSLEESYERGKRYGKNAVVSFKAKVAYEKDQKVCYCPTSVYQNQSDKAVCTTQQECPVYNENVSSKDLKIINPAHGCVIGKKTKSIAKFFAKNVKVEIYPPAQSTD
ncbi:hypothetical protein [Spirulina sp. 06S082]|uniref:hypothetical protein n=1 Tax=Spirulina sp. 06S082 TaxID=3110248 RepID=UPI002B20098F|nr:hypothetical protein [Spirulina sp. 06S082]MEA5470570.1 hypothetical protein [Spirulina sp. 06S082]